MKGLTFDQARIAIDNTCRAMDVRAIAFEVESQWHCAVSVISLTYRSVQKVKEDHRTLRERLGDIGNEKVKVLFDSLPIDQLDSLLADTKYNRLNVAGFDLQLQSIGNDVRSGVLINYPNLNGDHPDGLYPYYEVLVPAETTPRRALDAAGILPSALGISRFEDLQAWLGVSVLGNSTGLVFVIPVYARIEHPIDLKNGKVHAGFSAHHWLFSRCNKLGVLLDSWNGPLVERKTLDVEVSDDSDDFVTGSLQTSFTLNQAKSELAVQFQFQDTELGLLCERQSSAVSLLRPDPTPLYTAFSHFDGGKNLETYLLQARGKSADDQFSSAVSWLLELMGLRVLNLSLLPKAEHLRVEGREEGSCDILASLDSEQGTSVLVIDCTTAPPRPDKQARVRLTAGEVRRLSADLFGELHTTVRPVIIVSKEVPELINPEYREAGTYIIDKTNLRVLLQLVRAGQQAKAVSNLCELLCMIDPGSPI